MTLEPALCGQHLLGVGLLDGADQGVRGLAVVDRIEHCRATGAVDSCGQQVALDEFDVGIGGGRIEFDQPLTDPDCLAVADMDGFDHGGFAGLNQLGFTAGDDLARCDRDHFYLADRGPQHCQHGERHDAPDEDPGCRVHGLVLERQGRG
ncbi:hypothetical protein D3C86_1761740 [compost metagenome]